MISKTVRFYPLPVQNGAFTLELPIGAVLLEAVPGQGSESPNMAALVDPLAATETRSFIAVEVEGDVNDVEPSQLRPFGSVLAQTLVFLFEVL